MAKKQIDGDGLDIPNRIKALPVKRTGPIVAEGVLAAPPHGEPPCCCRA